MTNRTVHSLCIRSTLDSVTKLEFLSSVGGESYLSSATHFLPKLKPVTSNLSAKIFNMEIFIFQEKARKAPYSLSQ